MLMADFNFTDFRGSATEPAGGVYYLSPDLKTVTPVLRGIAMANGVALSPDDKRLWVGEFGGGRLIRIDLADATTIAPLGSRVAYHFIGPSPDSMRTDAKGNVYVVLYGQGRVLVFDPAGIPIGQILLPGREQGRNLQSTNLAISPDTDDLYVVAADDDPMRGSAVFHAHGYAPSAPLFSHQSTATPGASR